MKIFSLARGAFHQMSEDVERSIISVPALGAMPDSTFVYGFNVTKAEKKSIVQCFNGAYHIYAFGADPEGSNFSVTFGVFMQGACESGFKSSGGIRGFMRAYEYLRVSKKPALVTMQLDNGTVVNGILTGLSVNSSSADFNMANVTLIFTDVGA